MSFDTENEVRGHPDRAKSTHSNKVAATVTNVGPLLSGLTNTQFALYSVGTDAVEAAATSTVITATAHSAIAGDVIRLTSGTYSSYFATVSEVAANTITLQQALPAAPANGVTFTIYRYIPLVGSSAGYGVVGGAVDHGNTVASNPVVTGVVTSTGNPSPFSSGAIVRAFADYFGRPVFIQDAVRQDWWDYTSPSAITDLLDDEARAAVAGKRHYIGDIVVSNTSATATELVIKDGATVKMTIPVPGNTAGAVLTLRRPYVGTTNTAVNVACLTTASSTKVTLHGWSLTES